MKRIGILCMVVFSAWAFSSCVKAPVDERSYDSFVLNPPVFKTPDGAKTEWSSIGLTWVEGDVVIINNVPFRIEYNYSESKWYTRSTVSSVNPKSYPVGEGPEGFYVLYAGDGVNGIEIEESTGYYTGVQAMGANPTYVPLAGHLTNNVLTLTPCCCVIRVKSSVDYNMMITINGDGGRLVTKGAVDPVRGCFVADHPDTEFDEGSAFSWVDGYPQRTGNGDLGYNYYVLPMHGETIKVQQIWIDASGDIYDSQLPNPDGLTLKKGVLYSLDLTQTVPNSK